MKQISALIIFLIWVSLGNAAEVDTEGSFKAACENCSVKKTAKIEPLKQSAANLLADLNVSQTCHQSDETNDTNETKANCILIEWLKAKYIEYPKQCREFFINQNGKLGSYSKTILKLILEDVKTFAEKSVFVKNSPDFDKYCPKFKDFNLLQKAAFHTWIFELTAFPESTCNVNVRGNPNAPTTTAVCMYQLEGPPSTRKWRSSGFQPERCAVSRKSLLTMEGCSGCAFDEYKRKINKDGTPFGVFNKAGKRISGSYWASQNPLPEDALKCFKDNQGISRRTRKPLYLSKCEAFKPNIEWQARASFFRRLPRFPLCGTAEADIEIAPLKKPVKK